MGVGDVGLAAWVGSLLEFYAGMQPCLVFDFSSGSRGGVRPWCCCMERGWMSCSVCAVHVQTWFSRWVAFGALMMKEGEEVSGRSRTPWTN